MSSYVSLTAMKHRSLSLHYLSNSVYIKIVFKLHYRLVIHPHCRPVSVTDQPTSPFRKLIYNTGFVLLSKIDHFGKYFRPNIQNFLKLLSINFMKKVFRHEKGRRLG